MNETGIVIEHGLPDGLREQGVALFEEAFGENMRMAVRDRAKRMAFMGRVYAAPNVIIARREGELMGMVGLSSKGAPYDGGLMDIGWDPRPYSDLLGWLGAAWAVWGLRPGGPRPRSDEIYVDGIAVAPALRGNGIGTRLLDEVVAAARVHDKRFVRLEVVDTNPRARALYERYGFKVTGTQSFRYQQRWTGFGAMISMELPVDAS